MIQFQRSDVSRLRQTGIGTVINCRAGVKMSSLEIPSQEEVNLLNIADFTGKQTTRVVITYNAI